ncbi:MAG: YcjX family protein [Magnetococcales bacterium]|nr:YcjX family protein [Magnetococcales bacterium]MBF0157365.1 YcjX family protein [Magnetococcales bacterium]
MLPKPAAFLLNTVGSLAHRSRDGAEELLRLAMDRQVRLAVTGLSQSGKTVFITSLIHQLLNALAGARLPFWEVVAQGRFRGARIMLQPRVEVPAFRYDQFIQPLTGDPPAWPSPTQGLSEIRLAIRYRPGGFVSSRLSPVTTLHLDIVDYPGEWLMDLPLLDHTFASWSAEVFRLCREEPRRRLSAPWRQHLESLDGQGTPDEGPLREASALYTHFLHRCKGAEGGLNHLQPGRFLVPGELAGTPLVTFTPLPPPPDGRAFSSSLRELMTQRFESYKERVVRKFYRDHFSRFDRQIVLVDLLKGLNQGSYSFADMQGALRSILANFRYGPSGALARLLRPRIDRLLFAATKVDHVAANQHHNVERLLNRMLAAPAGEALFEGVEVKTLALSSFRCTRTVARVHEGRRLSFVQGVPKGRDQEILLFPGEIPESIPAPAEWAEDRFHFVEFSPRRPVDAEGEAMPHLRLDQALEFLIGDKLR